MRAAKVKDYLRRVAARLSDELDQEGLEFTRVQPNSLGGWQTNTAEDATAEDAIEVPGGKACLGLAFDAFLSGDTNRRRLWMALLFTNKWKPAVAKAFRNCPTFSDADLTGGAVGYVKPEAVPERFDLVREELDGDVWISRYLPEGQLPSLSSFVSQIRRFLSDVRTRLEGRRSHGRAKDEGRDLLQGEYWSRTTDKAFRERMLRKFDHRCQACGVRLEFRGKKVIDLHHKCPLAKGPWRKPTPNGVLILCPNCHRMAHLASPPLDLRTLKSIPVLRRPSKP